ncbi:protease modulator HflC [Pseudofulvimonas gallinarii]|jgi:membrane protease subunit HflC|uniref:Protein HflC n=1 Tax=Pseudofulvimonas gallinarii TaxID=634155 RepID=A0A4S3KUH0_9GAMM|nr:protease modulator HflC [Pseudofulvimonas gallinarii]TCT00836.1 protease FtsH subunit HflC [Pseudofulvimonas gallinarii]THD12865.1 HflC protein [Pseudofulvimonas gallinarii]
MRPAILIVAALVLLVLANSLFTVSEHQTAALFRLGAITRSDIQPGLHFKVPFIESVRRFDRRLLTLDAQPERYLTSEKKDVSVDFFVRWRIVDVSRFYQATGGNESNALARLNPIVKEALRNEFNQRTLAEVVADVRTNLTDVLKAKSDEAARALGITVVDVRIKRIELPEDSEVIDSVFRRMREERRRVANELRAQGGEAAERVRADADRQANVLLAEAERDAQTLRGEGDARAAEVYAAAYGSDAEFYGFYRSLQAYREAFRGGTDVMVLDPNSEFFRYFGEGARAR